jgi:chromosome partitioning protein
MSLQFAGQQPIAFPSAPPAAVPGSYAVVEPLSQLALAVAPVTLQQRAAYAHSLVVGQTAQEWARGDKAAQEIADLYEWMMKQIA